ncbi:MAG: GGDEF domain-containing protein [Gammaproteobacteria bacterium]|nr:GGDEF domain-containing protein [Gammaproteobacteria bacterium]MDH3429232.1 GGDEF domain-containing protein [Gammaproteobacteria bacterium]
MSPQAAQLFQTLKFRSPSLAAESASNALDRMFQLYYIDRRLPVARAGLGLGAILVVAVCLMDIFMMPDAFWQRAVPYRIVAMLLPLSLAMAATFLFRDRIWLPYIVTVSILLVGISTIVVGGMAKESVVEFVLWGMIFTTFNVYLLMGLNFRLSMLAGWPIFLVYVGVGIAVGAPLQKFGYGILFLGFSNLVGSYVSYLLERNAREIFEIRRELDRQARTDGLTALHNRRNFDERLKQTWNQAKRDQKNIAIALVDIDHFKLYNDCYGHPQGDRCISAIAGVLASSVNRPLDIVARYGGEEFAIILYDATPSYAETFAHKLCHKVVDLDLEHKASSVSPSVTVSVGVAVTRPSGAVSAAQLLRRADDALYEAKTKGRNTAVIFRSEWGEQVSSQLANIAL